LMSLLARELPNEARIKMVRLSRDRTMQEQIAQQLIKSTTAICGAIGMQPIPLADLPILTTLQLVMISGIMDVSGRERSLRAATEFVAAIGVNVGAGMVLREGTRAVLKFFPGWGNVICGMVAGAGTYGLGRAAMAYFIEGLSLKDARQTYRAHRKRSAARKHLPARSERSSDRP
ncbi:MAG: YcjF family protein, partial [Chthoniobacterales bacterium]